MPDVRPILPTDVLPLVSYNARAFPNEAWTRERLGSRGSGPQALGLSLEQLSALVRARSAWISVRGQRLQGLVGARRRGSRLAWEVDLLIDTTHDRSEAGALLEAASVQAGRAGGEKLFVRLASGSPLHDAVLEAGFLPFLEETLFARVGMAAGDTDEKLRPLTSADGYQAYRLYNATTPETVRRSEAATFREWHASQESRWLRRGVTLVREHEGSLDALVRAARLPHGVVVDLCLAPAASTDTAPIIRGAVAAVSGANLPIYVLTPSAGAAVSSLELSGFDLQGDYVSLMHRTTRPVSMPSLVPSIAKTAVGV